VTPNSTIHTESIVSYPLQLWLRERTTQFSAFRNIMLRYDPSTPLRYQIKRNRYLITSFCEFDIHVTVHRDKFLIIKQTRCINYSN
jgi:hypothetical protein